MKVLLIYPYLTNNSTLWLPLGLPFVAARLRQAGHRVAIFDRFAAQFRVGRSREKVDQAMLEQVQEFAPDLVGLNTLSPLIYDTVHSADLLRSVYDGPMVAGGHHTTALPELTLRKIPGLDGVLVGEGEIALCQLADGEDPRQVPGLWWRQDGETISAPLEPAAQVKDLDKLPLPALDLMDMDLYTQRTDGVIRRHNLRAAAIVSSRGCQRGCRFCAESLTYGRGVRFHSPDYVLAWIERLVNQYHVDGIYFHDNDFLVDEERVRSICQGLSSGGWHRKVKWCIQARVEHIHRDLARLLKAAGCVLVEIGVESGSQEELDRLAKGSTPELNRRAIEICCRAGLDVHACMLTAVEGETVADLERRLAWLKRARPTTFQWSPLHIHPGTALYQDRGNNFFRDSEWTEEALRSHYSTDHLSAIEPAERRAWMGRHFAPFARRHWWRNAVGHYPLRMLARIAWSKLRRRWRSAAGRKSQRPTGRQE